MGFKRFLKVSHELLPNGTHGLLCEFTMGKKKYIGRRSVAKTALFPGAILQINTVDCQCSIIIKKLLSFKPCVKHYYNLCHPLL